MKGKTTSPCALDGWPCRREVIGTEQIMVGPILVIVFVCLLVAGYMAVVHRFLRDSEGWHDDDIAHPIQESSGNAPNPPNARREPQWAH